MLERIRRTIAEQGLCSAGEPLWVAVSGGVDSMVLLHVLHALGHPCQVAHVDHGLRGDASDADRELVRKFCETSGIPFRVKRVDVRTRMDITGESLQMAARSLRLEWFNELTAEGPSKVATAHHADDAIETFFLGLIQGMGGKGWGSIPARSGGLIRPLLSVSRQEILAYALEQDVPWREDASNADHHYLRNRVRHELLPMLERWRPGTRNTLHRNVRLFKELDALGRMATDDALAEVVMERDGTMRVPFERILGPSPLLILYHLLRDKGFHPERLDDIVQAITDGHTGARFPGEGVEVYVDRQHLVIALVKAEARAWTIPSALSVPTGASISIAQCSAEDIDPAAGAGTAWLDAERIEFPLEVRPWKAGDRMRPDGLGGSKLISDILVNAKVPRDRKDRIYVLADRDHIIWLCGMRLSEGVKATATSARVLKITWSGS